MVEFTVKDDEPKEEEQQVSRWTIHTDGLSTKNAGGVGVILKSPEGDVIKHAIRLQYATTNNETEYEAMLTELKLAKRLGATELDVHSDSQLIVGASQWRLRGKRKANAAVSKPCSTSNGPIPEGNTQLCTTRAKHSLMYHIVPQDD